MKHIYTLLFLCAVTLVGAQNKNTKKADQLYEKLWFADATKAYEKLIEQGKADRYVYERLGDCYFYTGDTKKAETFYKRVSKGRNVSPDAIYNYAQVLKANGKLAQYGTWMKSFATSSPNDSRAQEYLKSPMEVTSIMETAPLFEAQNMKNLNTEYSEFGGYLKGNDFYFSSARNTSGKKYHWDKQPYLDVYKASHNGDVITGVAPLEGDVNTKYHEGNIAITNDGKRMYFDRNDYIDGDYDKNSVGINQINIYYTELVEGSWQGVYEVPFNDNEYSTGHPALSADNKILYFVSDKPGGKGDSDIYEVTIDVNGDFGKPAPVGGNINTEGKEVFPYSDGKGNLYFSSNGHIGLGGLDGFVATATATGFDKPKNLGLGANSEADDFAFFYDATTKKGFMSSNREGGKGEDDIYRLTPIAPEPPCELNMEILVVNEYTDQPISGALLDMYNIEGTKVYSSTTTQNGTNTFPGDCEENYQVSASMDGFEENQISISATSSEVLTKTIKLRPIEEIIVEDKINLNPILFEYDEADILPEAAAELDRLIGIMNKYPKMIIHVESHTDTRGNASYLCNF